MVNDINPVRRQENTRSHPEHGRKDCEPDSKKRPLTPRREISREDS